MELDDIVEQYPKTVKLKDGSSATIRPLKMTDEKEFHTFFVAVPDDERILFKHRVTDPQVIHDWCHRIDYGKILPLLALDGDKVVADASLHQTLGGWKRHIGRLSVVVHPAYRGKGNAGILVSGLIDITKNIRLGKIQDRFLCQQKGARRGIQESGFNATLC